jgi:hypothetical protein
MPEHIDQNNTKPTYHDENEKIAACRSSIHYPLGIHRS